MFNFEISLGDVLQILSGILIGIPSLSLATIAFYYAYHKGAKLNIFQLDNSLDPRVSGGRFGLQDNIWLNVPFYIENIGGAKSTIITISAIHDNFDGSEYKILRSEITNDPDPSSAQFKIPSILNDSVVLKLNARVLLALKNLNYPENDARRIGVIAQDDLRRFPSKFGIKVEANYKDGRGRNKKVAEEIFFLTGEKLIEIANEIEANQRNVFPVH